jgi:hypothetical protein
MKNKMSTTIQGKTIDAREFPDLVWNADLVEYDGPIVSLFKRDNLFDSLCVWVDKSNTRNRWILFDVGRIELLDYLNGNRTLRESFNEKSYVWVFDTTKTGKRKDAFKLRVGELPKVYVPGEKSFLRESMATDDAISLRSETAEKYKMLLAGDDLYVEDLAIIPKTYQQLYSFHYGLTHIDREAVAEKIKSSVHNWNGGISSVNLFSGLQAVIPAPHKARVAELEYASPGHITLSLLPNLAVQISKVVNGLEGEGWVKAESKYKACYDYFRSEGISGFDNEDGRIEDTLTPEQITGVERLLKEFLKILNLLEFDKRMNSVGLGSLGKLRAILAYHRRLKNLRRYIDSGMLEIPLID